MAAGKSRILIIIAVVVIAAALIIAYMTLSGGSNSSVDAPPSSTVNAKAPEKTGADITKPGDPRYDALLQQANRESADTANRNGTSAIPVIRSNVEAKQAPVVAVVPQVQVVTSTSLPPQGSTAAEDEAAKARKADYDKAVAARAAAIAGQAGKLQALWGVTAHSTQQVAALQAAGSPAPSGTSIAAVPANPALTGANALARLGDTRIASLDTPIDTDNPLPMYRAHIVEDGPLNGAVLIGTIQASTQQTYATGVNLTFTTISIPNEAQSRTLSAVAVNANDAGSLKGDVNNHNWSRYAAGFGSAFVSGIGQGLLQGGREQQVITSTNGYAVQSDAFTNKQLLMIGAANSGQMLATNLQKDMSRPPTIKIPGGTTIAVFFTADLPAVTTK